MKLVVLGANGRTGRCVLKMALEDGAEVTGLIRPGADGPGLRHPRLEIVTGDPCDAQVLGAVFRGRDAVISTLGPRRPAARATAVYPRSAAAIATAARAAGLRRAVVTSSALLFAPERWIDRFLVRSFGAVVRDARRMEAILGEAGLDLTLARCGFLTNAEDARYRAEAGALPEAGRAVPRRALARFLLDAAQGAGPGDGVFGVARGGDRSGDAKGGRSDAGARARSA